MKEVDPSMTEITREYARSLLPPRSEDSNKATFGRVLNVAGSVNYRGAACLSSIAALKVGAGYATLACPVTVADSITSFVPDIVTIPLETNGGSIARKECRKVLAALPGYTVLSVGCGLFSMGSVNRNVKDFFRDLISGVRETEKPVIIDADGLTILAESQPLLLPAKTVLTPHPKELSRLLGISTEAVQADRAACVLAAARRFSATVVLKGHLTVISDGESVFVNGTGNSALAKAGTGDILTGMVSGFCAQGLAPREAACLAVYLHGLAGDLARDDLSAYSVLASDLLRFIAPAIRTLLPGPVSPGKPSSRSVH
jgi:yjeF C-terminal region, hydroxyethylthiazole kinase-related